MGCFLLLSFTSFGVFLWDFFCCFWWFWIFLLFTVSANFIFVFAVVFSYVHWFFYGYVEVNFQCYVLLSLLLSLMFLWNNDYSAVTFSYYYFCCCFSVVADFSTDTSVTVLLMCMIPPMCIYFYGVSTVSVVADISMFSAFGYFCVFIWELLLCVFWFHICLVLLCSLLLLSFGGHDVSMFDICVCVCFSYFSMFYGLPPFTSFVGFYYLFDIPYYC